MISVSISLECSHMLQTPKKSTPNAMIAAANSCIFLNAIWRGLRTWGTRQPELLHSLTVKLTETFAALRQAAEEKRLGWPPDAAYRWRATCWYSRSIHTSHMLCQKSLQRRGRGIVAESDRCVCDLCNATYMLPWCLSRINHRLS